MYEIRRFFSNEDFTKLNDYARGLDYSGEVNPADGVEYPDVSADVPEWVQEHVIQTLTKVTGRRHKINTCFFRLTCESTGDAPHQAHTDSVMGRFTFILYLQDGPEGAGTALVKHARVGGLHKDPWTGAEMRIWEEDHSDPDKWVITRLFEMEANKAVYYPSKMMHRAEPVGGFGEDVTDGRLVLTCFLDTDNG